MIFWAFALLVAAVVAAVVALVVDELTAVVAIEFFLYSIIDSD
jgi:uncharacterized membrane protein